MGAHVFMQNATMGAIHRQFVSAKSERVALWKPLAGSVHLLHTLSDGESRPPPPPQGSEAGN